MKRDTFDRAEFLTLVNRHDISVATGVVQNLSLEERADVVAEIGVKVFLRLVALRREAPFALDNEHAGESLERQITCLTIAELCRHFHRFHEIEPFARLESLALTKKLIAALRHQTRLLIWLLAQMDLNGLPPGSKLGRWLCQQFAALYGLRQDAFRKMRQRALRTVEDLFETGSRERGLEGISKEMGKSGLKVVVRKDSHSMADGVKLQEALNQIRAALSRCNPKDLTLPDSFIDEIDKHGLMRMGGSEPVKIVEMLSQQLDLERLNRLHFVETRLYHGLGKIAERLLANCAWIFRFDATDGSLHADISHNSDLTATHGSLTLKKGQGIVGHVASTRRPYEASDVSDKAHSMYVNLNLETRSEIAVPVTHPQTHDLLAVVNLESQHPFWFNKAHGLYVQSLAASLAPDLIVHNALHRKRQSLGGWHFRHEGWSIDDSLSKLCECISRTLRKESGVKVATMIWEYDQEKDSFWVRGTSGYDYEYSTQTGLPASSFVGSVFRGRKPVFTPLNEAQNFLRQSKAKALGVEWIAGSPIFTLESLALPWGVLSIYGFRANEKLFPPLLEQLASLVGQAIVHWERTRECAASAYAFAKVSKVPDRGNARNEAVRDILQEILGADGVSLFISSHSQLQCVATTGLETATGPLYDFQKAIYDTKNDGGPTVLLSKNPGSALRRLDATNDDESIRTFGLPERIRFINRYKETAAWSPMERRRFIGLGLERKDKAVVVARAVRRAGRRPFRERDGVMLAAALKELVESISIPTPFSKSPEERRRFLRVAPCQIDVKIGALFQDALIHAPSNGAARVKLYSLAQVEDKSWLGTLLCSHGVSAETHNEEIRSFALPKQHSQSMFHSQGPDLAPLTILASPQAMPGLLVPFGVPQFGSAALYMLKVENIHTAPLRQADVVFWTCVAQWLTVTLGFAGLEQEEDSAAIRPFTSAVRQAFTSQLLLQTRADTVWTSANSLQQNQPVPISLGPTWLGYASPEAPVRLWLECLISFLESSPRVEGGPFAKKEAYTIWRISKVNQNFIRFMKSEA